MQTFVATRYPTTPPRGGSSCELLGVRTIRVLPWGLNSRAGRYPVFFDQPKGGSSKIFVDGMALKFREPVDLALRDDDRAGSSGDEWFIAWSTEDEETIGAGTGDAQATAPQVSEQTYDLVPDVGFGMLVRYNRPASARHLIVSAAAYRVDGAAGGLSYHNCTSYTVAVTRTEGGQDYIATTGLNLNILQASSTGNPLQYTDVGQFDLPKLADSMGLYASGGGITSNPYGIASPYHVSFLFRWSD